LAFLVCLTFVSAAAESRLVFEENRGQAPPAIRYFARHGSMRVAVEDRAFTLAEDGEWVRFSFFGAAVDPVIRGERLQAGTRNYFVGNDPSRWVTNVRTWERVRIDGLYPGVDVVFHPSEEGIEYDFIVAPGASPERIAMRTEGTMRLRKDAGALIASTMEGVAFRQSEPLSFQASGAVKSAWILQESEIRFELGAYDRSSELIIDPVIVAATYIGGSSGDEAHAIAVDAAGNIYVGGDTYSGNYPFLGGAQSTNKSSPGERDVFVTKFDPSGRTVIYSTYFGGARGRDLLEDLAVDPTGAVYFGGATYSTDLPVSANAFQKKANKWVGEDGFLVRLSAAGNAIVYCTYLTANSDVPSTEVIRGVAVDDEGRAFVVGDTTDPTWPITAGAYRTTGCDTDRDAFVTKVNADGSGLLYSTYLCGSDSDFGHAIAVDAEGNAIVTGTTYSADFPQAGLPPVTIREGDAWVAKLNADGSSLLRATLVGGSEADGGTSLALGPDGSVYIAGITRSIDFPAMNGYQQSYRGAVEYCQSGPPPQYCGDSYIARLDAGLSLLGATYLGGARSDDRINAIAASSSGVVAVGTTESSDYPLVSPTQSTYAGHRDAFVALFDPVLRNLTFSTFAGGSEWDLGESVAFDAAGAIHLTGSTLSTDFPISNAYQALSAGAFEVFLVKFSAQASAPGRRRAIRH
jgi:hypothetical protein